MKYPGEVFVLSSGKENNHFADGENTLHMFEAGLGPHIAKRRRDKGYPPNEPACLLYDAFTGFECVKQGLRVRRDLWKTKLSLITCQGDGKWSVHGSPCDFNHAHFRRLTDTAEDVLYGMDDNPFKRRRLDEAQFDSAGVVAAPSPQLEDLVNIGRWAMRQMSGPLRRQAWIKTLLFTMAEMAEMNPPLTEQYIAEESSRLGESTNYRQHIELADKESLALPPLVQPMADASLLPPDELWQVARVPFGSKADIQEGDWRSLPSWLRPAFNRALTSYKHTLQEKRAKLSLCEEGTRPWANSKRDLEKYTEDALHLKR